MAQEKSAKKEGQQVVSVISRMMNALSEGFLCSTPPE
jgi:hypothetical protein